MRAVINLSTEKYRKGQQRLFHSLKGSYDCILYTSEMQVNAPLHSDNNYGFKPAAFVDAMRIGYKHLLWLDASMLVIKDLQPIFDIIEQDGYFFQDSGWMNERWCPAHVSDYFGTNEGRMLSSGVLGLNLETEIGRKFLNDWLQAMQDGMFHGSHEVTRHDQTCASIIAYKMGLKLQDGNTFMVYGKMDEPTISEKTLLLADGIC